MTYFLLSLISHHFSADILSLIIQEVMVVSYDMLLLTSVPFHIQFPLPEMLPTALCQTHPCRARL